MTNDMIHYNEVKTCRVFGHQVRTLLMLLMVLGGGEAMAQVTIHGSVYGGGNQAAVKTNTSVNISDGNVVQNVYGGGKQGNVEGTTEVNICAEDNGSGYVAKAESGTEGHGVQIDGNVFGGGEGSDDNFFCNKAMVGNDGDGAGQDPNSDTNKNKGTTVRIGNGTIGTATTGGDVYGGGEIGRVEWNTQVMIGFGDGGTNTSKPEIKGNVFGAGKGVSTHGFSALVRGNSTVTIAGDAQIGKNVYGGGQIATVGRYVVVDSRPTKPASGGTCTVTIQGNAVIGTVAGGDVFGAGKGVLPYEGYESSETPWSMLATGDHNVYNCSTSDEIADYYAFIQTLGLASYANVTIGGDAKVKGSVYGGSENGFLQAHTSVTIQGSSKIGYDGSGTAVEGSGRIYGGGRGDDSVEGYAEAGKVRGNTNVTISNGSVNGSVFGGGEKGYTIGSATVNIEGGTIEQDVYGGGALADTNTGKEGGTTIYVPVPGLTANSSSVEGLYENTYKPTNDEKPVANKTYYLADGTLAPGTTNPKNAGYYEWSETDYKVTDDATAQEGKIYYTLIHPTTVNLFSGLVKGDAYGGGLGQLEDTPHSITAIEAKVYGDVTVNLGNPAEANNDAARATAFELNTTSGTIDETTYDGIASSGRIFGCNNLNGSPKGAVTVNVYRTTALNNEGAVKAKPTKTGHNTDPGTYELAAVYGGGNLAMYDPTNAETPAKVNIYGCGLTSIEQVYGGGNAAPVPGSKVMVEGTYEIYQVFGGGNGKDIIKKNGTWMANPGADVGIKSYTGDTPNIYADNSAETSIIGVAKVSILGGTIHYVFGGSNTKGDVVKNTLLVLGSENIQACEYNVGKAYGGANDAPMSGDIVIEMGCTEGLDVIYGGARNADVNGNIVLNITGGHFGKVFGGNDNGGAVKGSITVNIEERSCLPIEIDELYGGGENAPYSVYGYETDGSGNIIKDANSRPTVLTEGTKLYADPQVNVISATSIGTIYGGGYGATATMVGNPHVNINMTQGTIDGKYSYQAEKSDPRYNESADGYSYKDASNNKLVLTSTEATASNYPKALKLGSVGTVFGGGNAAEVKGNTFVCIGTGEWLNKNGEREMKGTTSDISTPTIFTYKKPTEDATAKKWTYQTTDENDNTVTVAIDGTPTPFRNAAQISGSVYGGGNEANVTGSTQVVICATEGTDDTYNSVTVGTANVTIDKDVFGAGKGVASDATKALVSANTKIVIGGGSVMQSIYGGGELSQVGGDTNIDVIGGTIGTTNHGGETYGNIYGGGKGNKESNNGAISDATLVAAGLIKGNTNITVSGGSIIHNVYGGGAHGSVGTFTYDDNGSNDIPDGTPISCADNTGKATIHITGGTIGTDGHENGMIFGSSRGDVGAPDEIHDKLAWVNETEVVIGSEGTNPIIHGSLYGSGENGHTFSNASVTMNSGEIGNLNTFYAYRGNVYGGGCGTDKYWIDANENGNKDAGEEHYNAMAGIVKGNATVTINGGSVANNIYGAGAMGKVEGSTHVTINTNGVIGVENASEGGNVYGAARGEKNLTDDYAYVTNSWVEISKGTVLGSVYGGGRDGIVKGAVLVEMKDGEVKGDVYGGGALAQTNTVNTYEEITEGIITEGDNKTDVDKYYTRSGAGTEGDPYTYTLASGKAASGTTYYRILNTTDVTLSGGTIDGNLYGGGLGQKTGVNDATSDIAADVNGPITVTVSNGRADNVFGCNNINGSPKSTVTVNITGTTDPTADRPQPILNVYGGGNQAAYTFADEDHPLQVNISGGAMGYVFGGGLSADVAGGIEVNVSGGKVIEDVYGGGALANTNTANWKNGDWEDQATGTYYAEVKHLKAGESSVNGYYTRTGDGSNEHPYQYSTDPVTGTAVAGTTYCKKINYLKVAAEGTKYETFVNLTGGTIGNAYGGGLGQLGTGVRYTTQTECDEDNAQLTDALQSETTLNAEQAAAYNAKLSGAIASGTTLTAAQATAVNTALGLTGGDAYAANGTITAAHAAGYNATLSGSIASGGTLTAEQAAAYNAKLPGAKSIGDWKVKPADGNGNVKAMVYGDVTVIVNGTAFTSDVEYISGGAENVAKHGRVFGGNNLNGTPKGKVTVYVNSTKHTNHPSSHVKGEFEIQGVYGGGNLADYVPQRYYNGEGEEYKHIEFGQKSKVYIDGCTKTSINKVYGGGNAASVPFTDVEINGAFEIGYVFGGGNGGDKVNYGDGWEANPGANVPGYTNVMLKGGTIGQAFGGSDTKGTVGGTDVKQETNADCPLHIVNLYGAGNGDEASSEGDINITVSACGEGSEIQNVFGGSYKANIKGSVTLNITSGIFTSVYGGNDRMGSIGGPITVNIEETDDCSKPIIIQNLYGGCYQTAYPGVGAKDKVGNPYTTGNITVNVKSATRIDRIFGGSENGAVTGNTIVNINMVEGSQSGHNGVALPSYYGEMEPSSLPSNITVTDTEGGYVEVYGLITNANADATNSRSSVVGYYTKEDTYSSASTPVEPSTTYYERLEATNNNYYPVAPEKITVGTTNVGDEGYFTKLEEYNLVGGTDTKAETGITYYELDGGEYKPVDVTVGTTVVSSYYTKAITYPSASGTAAANTTYYRLIYNYSPVSIETVNESNVTSYYTKAEGEYESAEGLAVAGTNYFKKAVKGNIATGIGTIGDVFGGGNKGNVSGDATVNIVTESTVTMESLKTDKTKTVLGADITGDVFGGGNLADVQHNTYVNICAKKNGSVYEAVAEGDSKVKIGGSVYGGGKGDADNFFCDKGMVGVKDTNNGSFESTDLGTHIHIGNGTIGTLDNQNKLVAGTGNVYGGGMVGRVEYHSVVEVGLTPQTGVTSAPEILGNVFGGGKGVETHGYAALLRGHTNVTVQQYAKVRNSVYGGGEISTIGRFWIKNVNNLEDNGSLKENAGPVPADLPSGMPYKLRDGGKCTVNILDNAEIGPTTAMAMPTFEGNVFGAGKGFLPKVYDYTANNDAHRPRRVNASGQNDYFVDEDAYMVFIETQALVDNTNVTIADNAFVKGSVYGGSENGRVLNDTHVNITGGQIGCSKNSTNRLAVDIPTVWDANYDASTAPDLECPSWTYDKNDPAPYDPFATADGDYDYSLYNFSVIPEAKRILKSDNGKPTGKDGHTFYGNVFGGGSGKDPYKPGYWHRKAGAVGGNTYVNITGGHILTSVYGGNEHTDVGTYAADNLTPRSGGKCTVNMTGGTLGVPRTLAQIAAHPVTCYLFGAGKGDQRIFFNTWTNVISTEVNISGNARIYGSTFGGGEDGHVIRDAVTNIGGNVDLNNDGDTIDEGETLTGDGVKIGTWGTSYVDGNVFGGGRGFSGEALTAGTVGGNTTVNISNGTMLGSIYGGGRLASVGTYFTDPNDPIYGQFQEDVAEVVHYTSEECTAYNTEHELESGDAGYLTTDDIKTPAGSYGHVEVTISGGTIGNASPAADSDYSKAKYSGNVFGGSMGRITLLDGTSINPMWPELAQVKTSIVNITGASTQITRNVYGGGEFGTVRENAWVTVGGSRTTVGSYDTEGTIAASGTPTIDGSVFGGGYGSDDNEHMTTIEVHWNNQAMKYTYTPMQWAGDVGGNTYVSVKGGNVKQNVYGGGELASVGIINYNVNSDAPVGITTEGTPNYTQLKKHDRHSDDGKESYTDFGLSWPYEFTYVPCNPTGDIGGQTKVNITGGTIGDTGSAEVLDNTGYVFGGGKGKVWFGATATTPENIAEQRYREAFCANVRASQVTIGTGASVRTVYGGGEDGHVYTDANVIIDGGTIDRSVFGGGKGEGIYRTTLRVADPIEGNPNHYTTAEDQDAHSWTAGRVYGNTNVTMNGGSVGMFIYGGGNLASVGKGNYASGTDDYYPAGYGEMLIDDGSTANINEGRLWTSTYNPEQAISETNKPDMAYHYLSSGKSTVTVLGGRVGPELDPNAVVNDENKDKYIDGDGIPFGSVFGGSRGMAAKSVRQSPRYRYMPDFFLGYVNQAFVNIGGYKVGETTITSENTPTIVGSVYGGGQDGHVRNSTEVKVFKGNITGQGNYEKAARSGHLFGAGSGIGKYTDGGTQKMHYGSGSVTCTTLVEVNGGTIAGNIYGGGAMSTVGPPRLGESPAEQKEITGTSDHSSMSHTQVDIKGGTIRGSVFGAGRGPSDSFYELQGFTTSTYDPEQFATDIWSTVNISGGSIEGNVYGGGEGGRVTKDTEVNLTGGVIGTESADGDVFGGGKGTKYIESDVGGNTTVDLNPGKTGEDTGCVVRRIFGCNDLKGTPKGHVLVRVYATQHRNKLAINDETNENELYKKYAKYGNVTNYTATSHGELTTLAEAVGITSEQQSAFETAISGAADADKADKLEEYREAVSLRKYDVEAVYGGGNLAAYVPTDPTPDTPLNDTEERTEVLIEGCQLTSIKQVYGGGNAASVPATRVEIREAYEIDEVFGGGNGKDNYQNPTDNNWYQNPGANVGYKDFTQVVIDKVVDEITYDGTTKALAYRTDDKSDADTPEHRLANYGYGSGMANTEVRGGRVHMAYGGSNNRGNISKVAMSVYQESGLCELNVDKTYGAGKDAETDAQVILNMECVTTMDQLFGGSTNADVNNDIYLKVTNGTYNQVFGGNDTNGAVNGSITVIVEESGCTPIEIKELYAGGYLAPYSIYGYQKTGSTYDKDDSGHLIPLTSGDNPKLDPHIDVISATKIGDIYGGGYKADVVGSPRINVNMTDGMISLKKVKVESVLVTKTEKLPSDDNTYAFEENGTKYVYKDASGNIYDWHNVYTESGNKYVYKDTNLNSYDQANVFEEASKYYVYASGAKKSYAKTGVQPKNTVAVTRRAWVAEDGEEFAVTVGGIKSVYEDAEHNLYDPSTVVTESGQTYAILNYYIPLTLGYIGNIFGGGNEADIIGDTYIDIGTGKWIKRTRGDNGTVSETDENNEVIVENLTRNKADILVDHNGESKPYYGNFKPDGENLNGGFVFGGGNHGIVTGNTYVTMGAGATVENSVFGGGNLGSIGTFTASNHRDYTFTDNTGICNVTIIDGRVGPETPTTDMGNVFGGGKGSDEDFYCEEAMAYKTNVSIENGTVTGNVYGGGKIARLENNTEVTIGKARTAFTTEDYAAYIGPTISGDVFAAGKGVETHGYSALVRGNPSVTIQGKAKVRGSVYGGGEIASVARYRVVNGSPVAIDNESSGNCLVTITDDAEIGPDNMKMVHLDNENNVVNGEDGKPLPPDDTGHVFGAGKGILPKVYDYVDEEQYTGEEGTYKIEDHFPRRMLAAGTTVSSNSTSVAYDANNIWEYFGNDADYHAFIETLALSSKTDVTISGDAFVKGSVYGGSLSGIVQHNTHVTIKDDCQIGNGDGVNRRYNSDEWAYDGSDDDHSLAECAHWEYDKESGAPYDPFATHLNSADGKYYYDAEFNSYARGGSNIAKDGHTYYGNVFGGGSGVIPYAPGKWHRAAGVVRGNTVVDILGGHILTSVYGGNEHTDVGIYDKDTYNEPTIPKSGGKCTINMTGGTVGVPRTLAQIAAHPVTCYVFGAGKGDTRTFFNTWTSIREAEVNISGNARIYGSVFGGGEDGHIIENAETNIGTTTMTINGVESEIEEYGVLIGTTGTSYVDGNVFGAGRGFSGEALTAGSVGGNATININGGTMLGSVYGGGRLASVGIPFTSVTSPQYGSFMDDEDPIPATYYTAEEAAAYNTEHSLSSSDEGFVHEGDVKTPAIPAKPHGNIFVNISGGIIGHEINFKDESNNHTTGGNIYGGSMGRLGLLNDEPNPLWPQLGQVKTATVTITGGTIKSNVYGGGELGTVRDKTTVEISGGTVERDVYGGGYGSKIISEDFNATVTAGDMTFGYNPMKWAGMVGQETNVNISGGRVKKSVYGGGEMASVGIINYVLGTWHETEDGAKEDGNVIFKIKNPENPKTYQYAAYANIVKHEDETNSFALSWPYKTEYFQGYEGKTNVTITGGRIGLTGTEDDDEHNPFADKDNGDVYGGGKGLAGDFNDYLFCANVGSTEVTIDYDPDDEATTLTPGTYKASGDCIAGAVYGGAENGHVMGDTKVTLTNGLIGHSVYGGGSGKGTFTTWLTEIPDGRRTLLSGNNGNDGPATRPSPTDNTKTEYEATCYSITAGKVFGNTEIEMTGGYVVRNIYGGGNMGSVGKGNYAGGADDYSAAGYGETLNGNETEANRTLWDGENSFSQAFLNSGKCTVKITGGTVGYVDSEPSKSMYPLNDDKQPYDASLPYGNIFGGCRGESAPNILESPRYLYCPEFFVGYANETEVTIGKTRADFTTESDYTTYLDTENEGEHLGETGYAPKILGSIYGGGQDGHVRRDTYVTVNSGEIGMAYNEDNQTLLNTTDLDDLQWLARGNVYGAGSGIGKYKYDINHDGDFGDVVNYTTPGDNPRTSRLQEEDVSTSAGSVTRFTTVNIYGGTIHRNVYGGGSSASVGAPKIGQSYLPYRKGDTETGHGVGKQSLNQVNIASTIGTPDDYQAHYGGEVYGASRGIDANNTSLATSIWTEVNLLPGTLVQGNVYGGGDNGMVKRDADVNVGTPWTATISAETIAQNGGSTTITIKTKDKWTVTSDDTDGITISKTSGEGDATITITAAAYTTARTIHLTVTGTGRSQTFTIKQE